MINAPLKQFKLIRKNPKILVPIILSLILTLLSSIIVTISLDISKLASQLPQDLEVDVENMQMFIKVIIGITSSFGMILGTALTWFLLSAVQLIFAKLKKSNVTYKTFLSMNIHIGIIGILGTILNAILVLILD
ncbi:YIP1 family protein [Niallia sp. FSL R7-0648]|uniref:YIP1 family protein n=1 Tax=Niallia sp. FSL R7-0648 TaxID=2954521 RepID=UPI004046A3D7